MPRRPSLQHHALAGLPDGAGLVLMDPAEVPAQSEPADAPRATTSQLSVRAAHEASRMWRIASAAGVPLERTRLKPPQDPTSSRFSRWISFGRVG
ncbi:hypothetical protein EMIHUDRAFT_215074 [Emiliania huxleyi CCMP1516]|uniref:Uncharacterized protein n=2 Tax=Emiliania huxleyi TaxID=2903 RepID=A0A0D3IHV3_EMIH1|nr:hypothetical protein EMIHUDRAFT_215074 [Emiliania huxleyi CCMP1516]EOD10838.1 hypothetical protein EMIHUDRAFT_215074 [Emiliania huxleyi CCMP1516]|eukprot:XP_005763267.1 hypothetical protein EMIHUDRAFT_215074 [Emiliania huxleyi CCMP1516]